MPPVFFSTSFCCHQNRIKGNSPFRNLNFSMLCNGIVHKKKSCSIIKFWIWMRYGVAGLVGGVYVTKNSKFSALGFISRGFKLWHTSQSSMALQLLEAHGAASQGPLNTMSRNPSKQSPQQNIEFWVTWNPPTKIGWTIPHYYPKHEIWMIIFCE